MKTRPRCVCNTWFGDNRAVLQNHIELCEDGTRAVCSCCDVTPVHYSDNAWDWGRLCIYVVTSQRRNILIIYGAGAVPSCCDVRHPCIILIMYDTHTLTSTTNLARETVKALNTFSRQRSSAEENFFQSFSRAAPCLIYTLECRFDLGLAHGRLFCQGSTRSIYSFYELIFLSNPRSVMKQCAVAAIPWAS